MFAAFLALFVATSIGVVAQAAFGDTTSGWFVGCYIAASVAAYGLSRQRPDWAARLKWAWLILSLVMIAAILRRSFDGLQLS